MLTSHGLDPRQACLPDGSDPAALVADGRSNQLSEAIENAQPLADKLIDEALTNSWEADSALQALRIAAASPSVQWGSRVERVAAQCQLPISLLQSTLLPLVRSWNTDPRCAAEQSADGAARANPRLTAARATGITRPTMKNVDSRDRRELHHTEHLDPRSVQAQSIPRR
jgi:hypothetical protein